MSKKVNMYKIKFDEDSIESAKASEKSIIEGPNKSSDGDSNGELSYLKRKLGKFTELYPWQTEDIFKKVYTIGGLFTNDKTYEHILNHFKNIQFLMEKHVPSTLSKNSFQERNPLEPLVDHITSSMEAALKSSTELPEPSASSISHTDNKRLLSVLKDTELLTGRNELIPEGKFNMDLLVRHSIYPVLDEKSKNPQERYKLSRIMFRNRKNTADLFQIYKSNIRQYGLNIKLINAYRANVILPAYLLYAKGDPNNIKTFNDEVDRLGKKFIQKVGPVYVAEYLNATGQIKLSGREKSSIETQIKQFESIKLPSLKQVPLQYSTERLAIMEEERIERKIKQDKANSKQRAQDAITSKMELFARDLTL